MKNIKMNLNQDSLNKLLSNHDDAYISASNYIDDYTPRSEFYVDVNVDINSFPLLEMSKYNWINLDNRSTTEQKRSVIQNFLGDYKETAASSALYRKSISYSLNRKIDSYALFAWSTRVLNLAKEYKYSASYTEGTLNESFLRSVVQLSRHDNGPVRARDFLADHGIALILERHLSGTALDGASILSDNGSPVIGLTLRYDRLDNFWFTLLHELSHAAFHLNKNDRCFIDNFDEKTIDIVEKEANYYASNALIPRSVWKRSDAHVYRTPKYVNELAEELNIHQSIIAGRIQYETNRFYILREFIDPFSVKSYFPDIDWS